MRPSPEPFRFAADAPRLPRLDLYGPVHKGLRWALTSLLTRMGAADFEGGARVPELLDDLDGVLYLCASHVAHEDRHIHPALARKRPLLADALASEHRAHEEAIAELRAIASRLASGPEPLAAANGRALYLRFSSFVAEALDHMVEEELVVEPLLEQLYTDAELAAIQDALLASIGPDEMLAFLRVIVPANDAGVRARVLAGAKAAMPAAGFAALIDSYRPNLPDDEWRELVSSLA
jgi:hypothetical protein